MVSGHHDVEGGAVGILVDVALVLQVEIADALRDEVVGVGHTARHGAEGWMADKPSADQLVVLRPTVDVDRGAVDADQRAAAMHPVAQAVHLGIRHLAGAAEDE